MGFHPATGEELIPVSKEIADLWKKQGTRRSAKRIDPDVYPPFDLATGQPRIWYYRLENGEMSSMTTQVITPNSAKR